MADDFGRLIGILAGIILAIILVDLFICGCFLTDEPALEILNKTR